MRRTRSKPPRGAMWSLLLSLLVLWSVVSGGCAARTSLATPAQITLGQQLSSPCLRGHLPDPATLTVGDALTLWVEAEARAECERARGEGLVTAVEAFNAAQRDRSQVRPR